MRIILALERLLLSKRWPLRRLTNQPNFVLFVGLACIALIFWMFSYKSNASSTVIYYSSYCQCSRNLTIKAPPDGNSIDWCSEETTLRGPHQNVVSYSLSGPAMHEENINRYSKFMEDIAFQVRHFYPGWLIRVYTNIKTSQAVEHEIICRVYCNHQNVDLCDVNMLKGRIAHLRSKKIVTAVSRLDLEKINWIHWRHLPLLDPLVNNYMSRDMGSSINEREAAAVSDWIQSKFTFHVMRDHHIHWFVMMGGMFGVKVHQKRELMQGLTRSLMAAGEEQKLIEKTLWHSAKDDALIHDSYFCHWEWNSLPTTPFPTQRVNGTFVTDNGLGLWPPPEKCPVECRPANHQDWEYC